MRTHQPMHAKAKTLTHIHAQHWLTVHRLKAASSKRQCHQRSWLIFTASRAKWISFPQIKTWCANFYRYLLILYLPFRPSAATRSAVLLRRRWVRVVFAIFVARYSYVANTFSRRRLAHSTVPTIDARIVVVGAAAAAEVASTVCIPTHTHIIIYFAHLCESCQRFVEFNWVRFVCAFCFHKFVI